MVACGSRSNSSRIDFLPYYNNPNFTPHWINPQSKSLDSFHHIPSFSLINQHGQTITQKTLENKIYVADFFFATCPGICPKMTKNMSLIQNHFKNDDEIALLSHSVTPKKDSVAALAQYAKDHNISSPHWHLLTGNKEAIYSLGRKAYFVEEDLGIGKKDNEFLHTENFVLIDKQRHIRGIYNGLNISSVQQLIVDIETLKAEQIQ